VNLGQLIAVLKADPDPDRVLPIGFANPHSYRGIYADLAFEPAKNVTVRSMFEAARSALGNTYEGYKGGDFTMNAYTEVWFSEYGTTGETLGETFLQLLLSQRPSDTEEEA
jgi:hypothetical protein